MPTQKVISNTRKVSHKTMNIIKGAKKSKEFGI